MTIYQHFRPEEKDFIDQVLNWKNSVEDAYASKLTDFLDPREQEILKQIVGSNHDVKWKLFGGFQTAERKRALLFPEYFVCEDEDFQVSLFEIDYPKKFITLEHPQVLGSLMSLGLKRGKFGDILFQDDRIQFAVSGEIESYLMTQFENVGRAAITLKKQPLTNAFKQTENWLEQSVTASSLRLDTILSALYQLSRQKSQSLIQHGLVKINWTVIENPAFELRESDIISVRGHGRAKIIQLEGKTKKEKWRILAGKQK